MILTEFYFIFIFFGCKWKSIWKFEFCFVCVGVCVSVFFLFQILMSQLSSGSSGSRKKNFSSTLIDWHTHTYHISIVELFKLFFFVALEKQKSIHHYYCVLAIGRNYNCQEFGVFFPLFFLVGYNRIFFIHSLIIIIIIESSIECFDYEDKFK